MNREMYRRIGALSGLAIGIAIMFAVGQSGLVAGAVFGASGTVVGGIIGERLFDRGSGGIR